MEATIPWDAWAGLIEPHYYTDRPGKTGRKASVRAKVEHPFLIVKRDFAFTKTRYRGIAKNLNHLQMLFASANWLMRARTVALTGAAA
jgi:transposase, IS5 family